MVPTLTVPAADIQNIRRRGFGLRPRPSDDEVIHGFASARRQVVDLAADIASKTTGEASDGCMVVDPESYVGVPRPYNAADGRHVEGAGRFEKGSGVLQSFGASHYDPATLTQTFVAFRRYPDQQPNRALAFFVGKERASCIMDFDPDIMNALLGAPKRQIMQRYTVTTYSPQTSNTTEYLFNESNGSLTCVKRD